MSEIRRIAIEHFDCFVCVCRSKSEVEDGTDNYRHCSSGAASDKLGLIHLIREIQTRDFFRESESE